MLLDFFDFYIEVFLESHLLIRLFNILFQGLKSKRHVSLVFLLMLWFWGSLELSEWMNFFFENRKRGLSEIR